MLHILQIVILPHWVDVAEVTSKVVKRVEFGTAGMNITLIANSFRTDVKTQLVHQYDGRCRRLSVCLLRLSNFSCSG
jgi:hypothetical protein